MLTVLATKIPSIGKRSTGKLRVLRQKNVLRGVRCSKTRFYSTTSTLNALKRAKLKTLKHSLTFIPSRPHTGAVWDIQYINTVQYYKIMGIGPQTRTLADDTTATMSVNKSDPYLNSVRSFNSTHRISKRFGTSVKVRQFLNYVRAKSFSLIEKPITKLMVAYEGFNATKRPKKKVVDIRYKNPYAFIGLKKTPKNLARNVFKTMFSRARKLAFTSVIARTAKRGLRVKSNAVIPDNFFLKSNRLKDTTQLRHIRIKKALRYRFRKPRKTFIKLCTGCVPSRLPRLVVRKFTSRLATTLHHTQSQFSNLALPSVYNFNILNNNVHNPTTHVPQMFFVNLRLGQKWRGKREFDFTNVPSTCSKNMVHDLLHTFNKTSARLFLTRLLRVSHLLTSSTNQKASVIFSSLMLGWFKRVRGLSITNQTNLKNNQFIKLRQLRQLFKHNSYLLSWAKRARFRDSKITTIFRLWLGKFTRTTNPLTTAGIHLPLLKSLRTYRIESTDKHSINPLNVFGMARLNKSLRSPQWRLQLLNYSSMCKSQTRKPEHFVGIYKTTRTGIRLKVTSNLINYNFSEYASVSPYDNRNTPSKSLHALFVKTIPRLALKLPLFRLKLPRSLKALDVGYTQRFLDVSALYTTGFTRSPFFFYNLFTLKNPLTTDLIVVDTDIHTSFTFNIFPSANDLKVSIFRRLNRQKILARSRILALNSTTNLESELEIGKKTLYTRSSSWPLQARSDHFFTANTTNSSECRITPDSLNYSRNEDARIRRVRFKPGYGRIWRQARTSIREILNIHARYQYRLTPKLQIRYFQTRKRINKLSTLDLGFALMTTNLAPDIWSTNEFLINGYVFLNGEIHANTSTKLFVNDFIQLTVNLKFYLASRWLKNWYSLKINRITKAYQRKFRPSTSNKNIKVVRNLPVWFYELQYTYCDIPKYFEVDYFTLSVFVIHNRLELEKWMPTRADLFTYGILNMYNWKYIT